MEGKIIWNYPDGCAGFKIYVTGYIDFIFSHKEYDIEEYKKLLAAIQTNTSHIYGFNDNFIGVNKKTIIFSIHRYEEDYNSHQQMSFDTKIFEPLITDIINKTKNY